MTPGVVSLAIKVQQVDPQTPARSISLVLGVGAFLALVSNPVFGKLSDRTTSRFGMRRPWLLGGAVAGTLALLVVATAQSIPVMLIGWCLAQLAYNALYAAITALLPDQVPSEQRGRISGILGMCQLPALVVGTFIAQLGYGTFWMFMGPAAVGRTPRMIEHPCPPFTLVRYRLLARAVGYFRPPSLFGVSSQASCCVV